MERPGVNSNILKGMCFDLATLAGVHNNLREVSLKEFYPFLDLSEVLALSNGLWVSRNRDIVGVRARLDTDEMHDIFSRELRFGNSRVSSRKLDANKNSKLNPYGGINLKERLSLVPKEAQVIFRKQASIEPYHYVTWGKYYHLKQHQIDTNNFRVLESPFPSHWSGKNDKEIEAYAVLASRMLRAYSKKVYTHQEVKEMAEAKRHEGKLVQQDLFK